MKDLILCIDDDVFRYERLSERLAGDNWGDPVILYITDDPDIIEFTLRTYKDRILGVCLDHDMRQKDGFWMAKQYLIERNFPVAITSSNPVGADRIARLLKEYEVLHKLLPAHGQKDWAHQILKFFRKHFSYS